MMIYDAIIVGSGGAALSAAITLKQKNKNILLITKNSTTAAQTAQAQGGINGVLEHSNDSVSNHIQDTQKSSHGIGDHETIEFMCKSANGAIKWLDQLGVPFNRDINNNIDARKLGGASNARANYSSDYTGLKILQTLYDKVIDLGIDILEDTMVLSLLQDSNRAVCGVSAIDIKTTQQKQYLAQNTILASGGYGGVYHNFTTNSADTTGDGLIAAYKAGALLENMEMVQFHPTALKDKFILISESARGEGGYLVTKDQKRFVDELLPRDIVARKIYEKIKNDQQVYLDVRHLGLEKILHLMPQEYKLILDYLGLKMDQDLIPIIPAVHYTMGGIKVDKDSKTSLSNLYAIGECSSNGVHGANRLGGNSLLEIIVFGRDIVNHLSFDQEIEEKEYDNFLFDKKRIKTLFQKDGKSFYKERDKLGKELYFNGGVFRNKTDLDKVNIFIKKRFDEFGSYGLEDRSKVFNLNLKHYLEFENLLYCGKLIVEGALIRDESRGAHFRSDYPNENNVPFNIIAKMNGGSEKLWI